MQLLSAREPVIHDGNWSQFVNPSVNGGYVRRGLIPRDYTRHPVGCYANCPPMAAVDIPLIPRSEWAARIKEQVDTKSRLSDLINNSYGGQGYPSLDQNGQGFCWAYSTAGTIMALRAIQNQPLVRLSAHAVACKIKNFQDEGGWGALSMDYAMANGYPSVEFWKEQSMSRSYDTPATWENARLHKVSEGWIDLAAAVYDRNLTFDQLATCLLSRIPVVVDFDWWGHSVFAVDLVSETSIRIRNSWSDSWGERGFGVLEGSKAIPVGGVAPRVTVPSIT